MITIRPHSVILFQGDSITDTGRSRQVFGPQSGDSLGSGYARMVADHLQETYAGFSLQIYNRGISGDRIDDLVRRWENDTLRLQPDLISILIGVNDTWNHLFYGLGTDPLEYRQLYRQLLENTCQRLPDVQLVLCEPFILVTGTVTAEWSGDVLQRRQIVGELAREFSASFVPFQAAIDQAAAEYPHHLLLDDGVHPTPRGHQVLADCWLKTALS